MDPQLDPMAVHHLHEAGIDPARKARMVLDQRSVGIDRRALGVGYLLHRMRITHRHHRHQHGLVLRWRSFKFERPQRVVAFGLALQAGGIERYLGWIQHRRAHVHRHIAVGFQPRFDQAGHGLNPDAGLGGQLFVGHETHKGACAVAALLDFTTIGVIDAVAEIDAGRVRRFDHQHLVGADAEAAVGQLLPLGRAEVDLLVDRVDDDEVIAGAVHFGEFEFHVEIISAGAGGL